MSLLIRTNLTCGGKRLINLLHVSMIDLQQNQIKLYLNHPKESLFGTFLFFGGNATKTETLLYTTEQDAKQEFLHIERSLENYYKK
jgi:hypothetical protein